MPKGAICGVRTKGFRCVARTFGKTLCKGFIIAVKTDFRFPGLCPKLAVVMASSTLSALF